MVHFVRSVHIQIGRMADAIAWGHKVIDYVDETYGTNFQLIRNIAGDGHQLHFYCTYDLLAAFESVSAKLGEDQGYWAIVVESEGLLGGYSDNLYRTV